MKSSSGRHPSARGVRTTPRTATHGDQAAKQHCQRQQAARSRSVPPAIHGLFGHRSRGLGSTAGGGELRRRGPRRLIAGSARAQGLPCSPLTSMRSPPPVRRPARASPPAKMSRALSITTRAEAVSRVLPPAPRSSAPGRSPTQPPSLQPTEAAAARDARMRLHSLCALRSKRGAPRARVCACRREPTPDSAARAPRRSRPGQPVEAAAVACRPCGAGAARGGGPPATAPAPRERPHDDGLVPALAARPPAAARSPSGPRVRRPGKRGRQRGRAPPRPAAPQRHPLLRLRAGGVREP